MPVHRFATLPLCDFEYEYDGIFVRLEEFQKRDDFGATKILVMNECPMGPGAWRLLDCAVLTVTEQKISNHVKSQCALLDHSSS